MRGRRHLTDKICGTSLNRLLTENRKFFKTVRQQLSASSPLKNFQLSLSAVIGFIKSYNKHIDLFLYQLFLNFPTSVACRASHFIKLPCQTCFCLLFYIFLLVCFRRLSVLLPPMCAILVVCCASCVLLFCNFVRR